MCALGQHIDLFFDWCEHREICPWARGVAPDWHQSGEEGEGPASEPSPELEPHHLDDPASTSEAEAATPGPEPAPDTSANGRPPKPPRGSRSRRPTSRPRPEATSNGLPPNQSAQRQKRRALPEPKPEQSPATRPLTPTQAQLRDLLEQARTRLPELELERSQTKRVIDVLERLLGER